MDMSEDRSSGASERVRNAGSANAAELATYVVEKGKPVIALAERPQSLRHGILVSPCSAEGVRLLAEGRRVSTPPGKSVRSL
jgi:hypothetical protein